MFSQIVDKSIFFISLLILVWHSNAQSISRGEIVDWLDQTVTMDAPTSGMVISDHNLDLVRPFMPPGYIDEFAYKGSSITIQATKSYPLFMSYQAATNKYAGQATLGPGGELENYLVGRPFSNEQIAAFTPKCWFNGRVEQYPSLAVHRI